MGNFHSNSTLLILGCRGREGAVAAKFRCRNRITFLHGDRKDNILDKFSWNEEALKMMMDLYSDKKKRRVFALQARRKLKKNRSSPRTARDPGYRDKYYAEPGNLPVAIDLCPKCNGILFGAPLPTCEEGETGRHFYAECRSCGYFHEMFRIGSNFKKAEGV